VGRRVGEAQTAVCVFRGLAWGHVNANVPAEGGSEARGHIVRGVPFWPLDGMYAYLSDRLPQESRGERPKSSGATMGRLKSAGSMVDRTPSFVTGPTITSQFMLGILALIVIVIAIYEIMARVRDCRWISPDFTAGPPHDREAN
jgi:hypothetical protein